MTTIIRRVLPFLAIAALAGAACEVPIKKAPPKPAPPTEVGPGQPGVNPCATDPVVITGDMCDWIFQPDPGFATTFEFTTEAFSIGTGSLKAGPISDNPPDKFIAAKGLGLPVPAVESIAFDFQIHEDAQPLHQQFYLNVYVNIDDDSGVFYDCRFDYVASSGSTEFFTTVTGAANEAATNVDKRGASRIDGPCPATLAGMPEGSHVRAFTLNIGDTSANDQGLAGFLDNVRVTTTSGTTTYDFEPA